LYENDLKSIVMTWHPWFFQECFQLITSEAFRAWMRHLLDQWLDELDRKDIEHRHYQNILHVRTLTQSLVTSAPVRSFYAEEM